MSEENVATPPVTQEPVVETPVQPDVSAQIAQNIWNETPVTPSVEPPAAQVAVVEPPVTELPKTEPKVVDVNDWLKETFQVDNVETAKQKWAEFQKLQEQPPAPAEVKYANEESKKLHEAILAGNKKEAYNILHQQEQLERLETMQPTSAKEAAEIIKANLQFKHKDLKPEQIDRLFTRQYAMPAQPKQGVDQEDAEYALVLEDWKTQVAEREQDMIIDAQIAKPELSQYKSQLILPDIPKVEAAAPAQSQEELAKRETLRSNFVQKLDSDYKNFSGFSVTAKDGGVDLPINYAIAPEELDASKQQIANFDVNQFFDSRWFDDKGIPNIKQIQEDLYLLQNRDKVFQKIANEASAQRLAHHLKTKSNINVDGTNNGAPVTNGKTAEQEFAEKVWSV